MNKIDWSTKAPKEPGWYWFRINDTYQNEITEVAYMSVGGTAELHAWRNAWVPLRKMGCEWILEKIPEPG